MSDTTVMSESFDTLDMVGEFYEILLECNPELAKQFDDEMQRRIIIHIGGDDTNSAPYMFVNKVFPVLHRIYAIDHEYKLDPEAVIDTLHLGMDHSGIDQHAWKDHTPDAIKTEWEKLWLSIYDVTPASVKAMLPIKLA